MNLPSANVLAEAAKDGLLAGLEMRRPTRVVYGFRGANDAYRQMNRLGTKLAIKAIQEFDKDSDIAISRLFVKVRCGDLTPHQVANMFGEYFGQKA